MLEFFRCAGGGDRTHMGSLPTKVSCMPSRFQGDRVYQFRHARIEARREIPSGLAVKPWASGASAAAPTPGGRTASESSCERTPTSEGH